MCAVAIEAYQWTKKSQNFPDQVRVKVGLEIDEIFTREDPELVSRGRASQLQTGLTHLGPDDLAAPPHDDFRPQAGMVDKLSDPARTRCLLFNLGSGSTEIAWIHFECQNRDTIATPEAKAFSLRMIYDGYCLLSMLRWQTILLLLFGQKSWNNIVYMSKST